MRVIPQFIWISFSPETWIQGGQQMQIIGLTTVAMIHSYFHFVLVFIFSTNCTKIRLTKKKWLSWHLDASPSTNDLKSIQFILFGIKLVLQSSEVNDLNKTRHNNVLRKHYCHYQKWISLHKNIKFHFSGKKSRWRWSSLSL